jgi:hypothetical protein
MARLALRAAVIDLMPASLSAGGVSRRHILCVIDRITQSV